MLPNYCIRTHGDDTTLCGLRCDYNVTTVPGAGISTVK